MKSILFFTVAMILCISTYAKMTKPINMPTSSLAFLENKGQIRDQKGMERTDIDFVLSTSEMTLFIGNGKLHYQFYQLAETSSDNDVDKPSAPKMPKSGQIESIYRLDVELKGANLKTAVVKDRPRSANFHYYGPGMGPEGVTQVHSYQKVTYKEVYAGIDWVLYIDGEQLKYDFVVHPGGNISDIQLAYSGAQALRLHNGNLEITVPYGSLTEQAPYAYEQKDKSPVPAQYRLTGNTVSFVVGDYQGTLIIDPAVDWATYFGGALKESPTDVACDRYGYVYISGTSNSTSNIATTGAYQTSLANGTLPFNTIDNYLAKFDSLGQLQWATYYGGGNSGGDLYEGTELGGFVACDPYDHVYLAATTASATGIATSGSYLSVKNPASFLLGYLVQFNSDGIRQWSTYYGATIISDVTCDPSGNVYIAGQAADSNATTSGSLVTTGAHQTQFGGGSDGILVKFDSTGSRQWATYYGGGGVDAINALTSDENGDVYIAGSTSSDAGIISSSGETFIDSLTIAESGFLAKFSTNGIRQWGTYLNGRATGIAADNFNYVYVTGSSKTQNHPQVSTPGSHQPTTTDADNYYLLQFNTGSGLRTWGTYYGGEGAESPGSSGVACDVYGHVYLCGTTKSKGVLFPNVIATPGSHQDTLNSVFNPAPNSGISDAFVAQFDTSGRRIWATYYGGPAEETDRTSVACDDQGNFYLSGATKSMVDIASAGSYQATHSGEEDAFLVRFVPMDIALTALTHPDTDTICTTDSMRLRLQVENLGRLSEDDTIPIHGVYTGPVNGTLDGFIMGLVMGASATIEMDNVDLSVPGVYYFTAFLVGPGNDGNPANDTLRFSITVIAEPTVVGIEITHNGGSYSFAPDNAVGADHFHWDFGDGHTDETEYPTHRYTEDGSYIISLIVSNDCGADTVTQFLDVSGTSTIRDMKESQSIAIYPNPAHGTLYLKMDGAIVPEAYWVYNTLGQVVLQGNLQNGHQIKLADLAAGHYVLRLQTKGGSVVRSFQIIP